MATVAINVPGRSIHLSTDHAASSYGLPVLVMDDGRAYGRSDIVDDGSPEGCRADHLVRTCGLLRGRPGDVEGEDADRLLDAWESR